MQWTPTTAIPMCWAAGLCFAGIGALAAVAALCCAGWIRPTYQSVSLLGAPEDPQELLEAPASLGAPRCT